MLFVLINSIFGIILVGGALYMWNHTNRPKKETESTIPGDDQYVILSISVPKNNAAKPEGAEQFFAAIHGIFRHGAAEQPRISLEIITRNRQITFQLYVPTNLKEFVTSQIFAQYPTVDIKELSPEDEPGITSEKSIVATELGLKRPTAYPIKTFQNFEVDPLATTTGVLSSLSANEDLWIQMVIRPLDDDWQDKGSDEVKLIKEPPAKGKGFFEIVANESKELFIGFFKQIISPEAGGDKDKKDEKGGKDLDGPKQQAIKSIEEKITKLGFETTIRLVASANDEHIAKAKLEQVVGSYKQFNTLSLNSFVVKDFVTDRAVLELFKHRTFGDNDMIFNITELATLYHFPSETVSTPTIIWAGAKKGEPPANLPVLDSVPADELTILAQTNFRNHDTKFGIKRADRRLHTYIIGKTGTGKSTFIENMIYDDIREGRGVAVVDPHGQLIDHVLEFIPPERVKDIVYFNPADYENPIAFNILENNDNNPEMKNVIASGVVGIFKKIFGESWGPRLEYILRNSILAVLEYPNSTLLSVMRILTDNAYRRLVISEVKDPVIRDFFINEYEKYEPKFRQEAIAPIQNKVGQFLSSSIIRNIVGQPKSTLRIDEIMNNGKILLADLSTGKIGEDNSALLGSMLITKIQLAAMGRTSIPENERRDFYLYVDEFQNFATDSFATILSEARKYRLNLVMVNQYISQMPETVQDAVFGNVGTMVAFRVGANDAQALQKEFEPVFDVNDLVNQPNRHIYIKMAVDGVTVPAFSAGTLPPPAEKSNVVPEVVASSIEHYTTPRSDVEDYISEWSAPIDLNNGLVGELDAKPKGARKAPGNDLPSDKGFSEAPQPGKSQQGTGVDRTEAKPFLPPGQKIEILKDRFARNWYAVTNQADVGAKPVQQVQVTPPVHDGVLAPVTGEIIKQNIASQEQGTEIGETTSDTSQSGGGVPKNSLDNLITWDQAEELGLVEQSVEAPINDSNGMLPIDELT